MVSVLLLVVVLALVAAILANLVNNVRATLVLVGAVGTGVGASRPCSRC